MKHDEWKLANTIQSMKRRIELNDYARGLWMRYWELNCAKRWIIKETPTLSRHSRGSRNGRPVVSYHPVDTDAAKLGRVAIRTG